MLIISTLLIGAAVGLRYKVIALLPIMLAGAGIATYFFAAGHQTLSHSLWIMVTYGSMLQVGYAAGSLATAMSGANRPLGSKSMAPTMR